MTAAERLQEKAQRAELTAAQEEERGEFVTAAVWVGVAAALYEVADALLTSDEREAA